MLSKSDARYLVTNDSFALDLQGMSHGSVTKNWRRVDFVTSKHGKSCRSEVVQCSIGVRWVTDYSATLKVNKG